MRLRGVSVLFRLPGLKEFFRISLSSETKRSEFESDLFNLNEFFPAAVLLSTMCVCYAKNDI